MARWPGLDRGGLRPIIELGPPGDNRLVTPVRARRYAAWQVLSRNSGCGGCDSRQRIAIPCRRPAAGAPAAFATDLLAYVCRAVGCGARRARAGADRVHVDLWVASQQDRGAEASTVRRRFRTGWASLMRYHAGSGPGRALPGVAGGMTSSFRHRDDLAFMVPGYVACVASRRTISQIQTTTHCHAMPYHCGCPGYICQLKTARWYMSDLEAPAGRTADLAYVTVTDDIAARIASGELQPGARLLAERELARRYGVAYGTIRRAMKELRARGLISSVQGRGTFVARRDGPPPEPSPAAVLPPLTATLPITLAPRQHAAPEAQSREPRRSPAAPAAPGARRV